MSLENRVKRLMIEDIRENTRGKGVTCHRCHLRFGPGNYGAGDDHIARVCDGIVQIIPLELEGKEVYDVQTRDDCAFENSTVNVG